MFQSLQPQSENPCFARPEKTARGLSNCHQTHLSKPSAEELLPNPKPQIPKLACRASFEAPRGHDAGALPAAPSPRCRGGGQLPGSQSLPALLLNKAAAAAVELRLLWFSWRISAETLEVIRFLRFMSQANPCTLTDGACEGPGALAFLNHERHLG